MTIARFTEAWVRSAPKGQYTDETLRGFMCVVGKTTAGGYTKSVETSLDRRRLEGRTVVMQRLFQPSGDFSTTLDGSG